MKPFSGRSPRAEPFAAKPASESPASAEQLMEEVCSRENLEIAWKRVRRNKGSPGVDGMTIDAAKDYLREHWPNIRSQLLRRNLPAVAGQTGRDTQAGRRGQKARRALRRRQADPAGVAAGAPKALGPNVFRTELRLPAGTLRSSSSCSGPTLPLQRATASWSIWTSRNSSTGSITTC